jgi:hypothetical protein
MQRSISYQNVINQLLVVGLFVIYISLSSMYLLLPPMLAVLFILLHRALSRHDLFSLVIVSSMLLVFEAEKGFWFGSTLLFFIFLSYSVLPKMEQTLQCRVCMVGLSVLLAYPGYWLFVWFVNKLLLMNVPSIDWHIILYMIVEFLIILAFV